MSDFWIEKFRSEALPEIVRDIKPVRVLLFGSRVTGHATKDSDLDVILISRSFKGIPFIKRMEMVMRAVRFPKHVDYLCYTPEEFKKIKHSSSVVEDALEKAIEAFAWLSPPKAAKLRDGRSERRRSRPPGRKTVRRRLS